MSANADPSSNWQELLEAAKRESDPQKLAPLVAAAQTAIFFRWQDHRGNGAIELEAIAKATRVWRELQVTKLNFPVWEARLPPDTASVGSFMKEAQSGLLL